MTQEDLTPIRSSTKTYLGWATLPVLWSGESTISVFGTFAVVSWVNQMLFGIAQGLLNAAANLLSGGLKHLIFFDSPYSDPRMNAAFAYNLDIFPQLLAIAVLLGVASRPFADRLQTDGFMLIWKFLKVIIFVAVGRQIMHFGLLLVNAVGTYLYPSSYSMHFTGDSLQHALSAAGATGAGLAMTAIILSFISVLAALALIGIFLLREFLFAATFVLLPILGCMLYLDFGPFRDAADLAKMLIRSTTYLLLAGIVMAGLLQVGAAYGGAFVDQGANGGQVVDQQSMGQLVESYFFWLVGLIAPAFIGLKAAMAAGVSSRQIMGAGGSSRKGGKGTSTGGESQRSAIIEQARQSARRVDQRFNHAGHRAVSSVGDTKEKLSAVAGSNAPGWTKKAKPIGRAGKTATRRAMKDSSAGVKYAASNLGESPVDWARAGIDHYREEPLVEVTDESSETDSDVSSESKDSQEASFNTLSDRLGEPNDDQQ